MISSVNVTKSAVSGGFGHIYWRNPLWKTSFFRAVWYGYYQRCIQNSVKYLRLSFFRSSHQRSSIEIGVLKIFTKFIGNTCARISFLIKLQASGTGVFLWISCEVCKNTYFTEHLRTSFCENSYWLLTDLFKKSTILDAWRDFEYTSGWCRIFLSSLTFPEFISFQCDGFVLLWTLCFYLQRSNFGWKIFSIWRKIFRCRNFLL